MNTPHRHAEVIKAWADGAEIECKVSDAPERWTCTAQPAWNPDVQYRVKPAPPTYGQIANAAWQTDCDWELVASAVIEAYKAREGAGAVDGKVEG